MIAFLPLFPARNVMRGRTREVGRILSAFFVKLKFIFWWLFSYSKSFFISVTVVYIRVYLGSFLANSHLVTTPEIFFDLSLLFSTSPRCLIACRILKLYPLTKVCRQNQSVVSHFHSIFHPDGWDSVFSFACILMLCTHCCQTSPWSALQFTYIFTFSFFFFLMKCFFDL